jgi:UPF0755 protein
MRHVASNVLTLLILALIVVGIAIDRGQRDYAAPGPLSEPAIVRVERGDTMSDAAEALAGAGALPERTVFGLLPGESLFRVAARYQGAGADLKAGEYEIPARASMPEILELLTSGRSIQFPITIPEGLTSWAVVERLRAEDVLTGEIDEIPPEGSLAPETYNVDRGTERAALIRRMQARQERILAEAWENRAPDLPIDSPEEALILASIIEKETPLGSERPKVASVFVNRLRRGMRLQTDPTVVYGAIEGNGRLDRPPTGPELRTATPYNTYIIEGLPPTPIANPGRAAIEAALNPGDTPYYYFVADGTGGHAFAETLAEHNANVRRWRQIESQRDGE